MLHDPSPHRVSACPVHFLWDGRGHGRTFVRLGFLGFLLAGMAFSLSRWLVSPPLKSAALAVVVLAALSWGLGQALGFLAGRKRPARLA